jgi:hypothetical protein
MMRSNAASDAVAAARFILRLTLTHAAITVVAGAVLLLACVLPEMLRSWLTPP